MVDMMVDRILSGTSEELGLFQLAVLGVGANVLQGSQDIVGYGRWLRQMSAHHMEAQFIGYVACLDGKALGRGVTIDPNGFQWRSGRLDVDAIAGLKGILKHTLIIRRRNPEVRYLGIPLTSTHQSPDTANPHQTAIRLHPNEGQKHQANELKPKEVLSAFKITDQIGNTFMGSGPNAYKISHISRFYIGLSFRTGTKKHNRHAGGFMIDFVIFSDPM